MNVRWSPTCIYIRSEALTGVYETASKGVGGGGPGVVPHDAPCADVADSWRVYLPEVSEAASGSMGVDAPPGNHRRRSDPGNGLAPSRVDSKPPWRTL
jgi:hypothetical protein